MIVPCSSWHKNIITQEVRGNNDTEGYIVKYLDGYVSQSPKELFEKEYRKLDCEDFINSKE